MFIDVFFQYSAFDALLARRGHGGGLVVCLGFELADQFYERLELRERDTLRQEFRVVAYINIVYGIDKVKLLTSKSLKSNYKGGSLPLAP